MGVTLTKHVDIASAHFRWGWEKSPTKMMKSPMVRYYLFPVAHDRIEAKAKLNCFLEQISPVEEVMEEKMGRTRAGLFYFRQIVDSVMSPKEIDFTKIGRYIIRDRRFCERESGDVFNYLDTVYCGLIEQ
ncbi:MAG: hypothetical protein WD876_00165 [Candidatus Pacearchaeota archaeon]